MGQHYYCTGACVLCTGACVVCIPAKESSCEPDFQCRVSGIGVSITDGIISTGVPNFRRVGDSVPL